MVRKEPMPRLVIAKLAYNLIQAAIESLEKCQDFKIAYCHDEDSRGIWVDDEYFSQGELTDE